MEEDVEIEVLFKCNEKLLLEAVNETSGDYHQFEKNSLSSVEGTKSSYNKENITENLISDYENTYCQMTETVTNLETPPQFNDCSVQRFGNKGEKMCNVANFSLKQNNSLSAVSDKTIQNVGFVKDADDEVNQRILDLISANPVKYYLSQQNSCNDEFGKDDDDGSMTSDDDWDDEFRYKDDDFIDGMLEKAQLKPSKQSEFSGNKSLQKLEKKALGPLKNLAKMLLKRGDYLSSYESKLQQLSRENKERQKELQAESTTRDKLKGECSSTRCSFKKFGIPYFKDSRGFHPPYNKDYRQKLENDELIVEPIPNINNWTKQHKILMEKAIKSSLIEEKSSKLTKEITKLTETVKHKDGNVKKVLEKITEKQNELRSIYKKSFKELIEDESDHREYDWMKFSVSLFDGLHSPEECKRFWHLYLKPSIYKGPWSESEEAKLLEVAAKLNYQDWDKIAKLLRTNRSGFQCYVHYMTVLDEKQDYSGGKWTDVEDKKLMAVVNSAKVGGFIPWTKVSSYMGNRNQFQIYNRWANSLNPGLVKGRFSKEEDLLIVSGVEVFGKTFKELALLMNNRTPAQIRERYERYLLPKTAKVGTWSLEEDEKLLELVDRFGAHNWSKIAKEMKSRTRTQVRQRYGFIEKMRKKKPGWTVAQVKRRNLRNCKRVNKTNRDVASIKKVFSEVENVFHLSENDRESLLSQKLELLKDNISCRNPIVKGRKGKVIEIPIKTQVKDTYIDFFTNHYSGSLTKAIKSFFKYPDGKSNVLTVLTNLLEHTCRLPKSEEEVWANQRLSVDTKHFLCSLLNTTCVGNSTSFSKQQSCSSSQSAVRVMDPLGKIDCPITKDDDTIMMNDWWYAPPVNIASLNFSEFLKRTVFDYSYGMHKDIWESKIKRSQVVSTVFDCPVTTEEPISVKQDYSFPPNYFNALGLRSIRLTKAILEKMEESFSILPDSLIKEEVIEDVDVKMVMNPCSQLENVLLNLFLWPSILAHTKIRTFPFGDIQNMIGSNEPSPNKSVKKHQAKHKLEKNNAIKPKHKKRKIGNEPLDSVQTEDLKKKTSPKSESVKGRNKSITGKQKSNFNDNDSLRSTASSSYNIQLRSYSKRKQN